MTDIFSRLSAGRPQPIKEATPLTAPLSVRKLLNWIQHTWINLPFARGRFTATAPDPSGMIEKKRSKQQKFWKSAAGSSRSRHTGVIGKDGRSRSGLPEVGFGGLCLPL